MESMDVRAVVAASREVAHASCHLAAVAALIAKARDGTQEHFQRASEASTTAARCAFQLDDIYRRANGTPESVDAAEKALVAAIAAVERACDAIRAVRAC